MPTTTDHFRETFKAFRPSPIVRTLLWAIENIVNQEGRPYDHAAYPHLGAPGGPMDAFDDHRIRTISLQWATRLGKTFFGQVALTKTADTDPSPMLFASADESLAKEGIARLYFSVRKNRRLAELLVKPEREQRADLVEFRGSKIHVAWSRSVSTLSDKDCRIIHAGEYSKWIQPSTSREAHPHKLLEERLKAHWSQRKAIYEGTPQVKGRCPIERKRLSGSNCSYQVPCPHCHKYQVLEFGGKDTKHGIKWDRNADGRNDPETAHKTARYVCLYCHESAHDHHRPWMMRRGVWVPEGCTVKHKTALKYAEKILENPALHYWKGWANAKWISGTPVRDGQDYSSQLSSFYALSLGWGDFAAEFLKSKPIPQWLRNFVNSWKGETWEITAKKQTWEELGERLIVKTPHKIVPAGFPLLTMGIDKQQEHYVVVVDAWKSPRTSHTLHYGVYSSLEKVESELLNAEFARESGGVLSIRCTLIDGRYRPQSVYQFCLAQTKKKRAVFPAFGSPNNLGVECRKTVLGENTPMPGFPCVHMDTVSTQDFIEQQLHTLRPGDPGSTSLYHGRLADHQDFLEQLLNDAILPTVDSNGYVKEVWNRIDENTPNDYRDAKRLAFVSMIVATRNGPILEETPAAPETKAEEESDRRPKGKFNFKRRGSS